MLTLYSASLITRTATNFTRDTAAMRFPISKLSQFFRRSKSDSALSRRLDPGPQCPRRPLSAPCLDGHDTHSSLSSEFVARLPLTPVDLPRPVSLATTASSAHSSCTQISAASHTVVVEVLTRRIQELEAAVRTHSDRISISGSSASGSGDGSDSHSGSGSGSGSGWRASVGLQVPILRETDVSASNTSIVASHSHLSGAHDEDTFSRDELAHPPAPLPPGTDPDPDTDPATQTAALLTLLTPDGDRTMLADAYARVLAGDDPEDALVDAIKAAAARPASPWRTLLAPVVGPRAPGAYTAQVACTLGARREARGWRYRAAFWKGCARDGGRHGDTVTPSGSALEDVVEGLAARAVEVRVETAVQTDADAPSDVGLRERGEVDVDATPRPLQTAVSDPIRRSQDSDNVPTVPRTINTHSDLGLQPGRSSLSLSLSRPTDEINTSGSPAYANLPPLASVTFRESYSIRSLQTRRDVVSVAFSPSASTSSTTPAAVPSSPTSDKKRKSMTTAGAAAAVVAGGVDAPPPAPVPCIKSSGSLSEPVPGSSMAPTPAPVNSPLRKPTAAVITPPSVTAPYPPSVTAAAPPSGADTSLSASSSGSWDRLSSFIAQSFSPFGGSLKDTLALQGQVQGQGKASSAGASGSPVGASSPLASSPLRPRPAAVPASPSDPDLEIVRIPHSAFSSPSSSPTRTGASRIPVSSPKGAKKTAPPSTRGFMKRISLAISRPVLVDSTNAAAMGDVRPVRGKAGQMSGVTVRTVLRAGRGAARENVAVTKEGAASWRPNLKNGTVGAQVAGTSPKKMGRRGAA